MEKNGFEVEIVDNLDGYLVSIGAGMKYASILKNSIAHKKAGSRIVFLMKDKNAVEAALRQGQSCIMENFEISRKPQAQQGHKDMHEGCQGF